MTQNLQLMSRENQSIQMPTSNEWAIMREQAAMLVATNFLPQSIKTPEQAIAIMLQGRELGIPTMAALETINVIQGKPTVSPQLMLALIERSGQLENIQYQVDPDGVSVTMKRRNRTAHTEFFGIKEATELGVIGKENYKKQAKTMFKWRAVAACARTVIPDVVLGLYTPDEMGAPTDAETGEVLAEHAQIHSLPTKAQLTRTVQNEPVPTAPNHSVDEIAMREQIYAALTASGINAANALKKFDSFTTTEEKATAVWGSLKYAIATGIANQNWEVDETDVYLSGFGIESGLESATLAQLETVYNDMREHKMLLA